MLKRLAIGICTLAAVAVMTSGSAFAGPPTKADVLKLKGKGYKGEIEIEKGKPVTDYYTIRGDGCFNLDTENLARPATCTPKANMRRSRIT